MARLKVPRFSDRIREVSPQTSSPQGFSGGQIQAASDTGLEDLGQGMYNMGRNLKNIEVDRQNKAGALWSRDTITQIKADMMKWSNEYAIQDESPTGANRPQDALGKMQELSDEALKNAPSKIAADKFKDAVNIYKNDVFLKSTEYVADKTLQYQSNQLGDTVKNLTYVTFEDPNSLLENIGDITTTIDDLEDLPQTKEIEGYRNIWSKEKREKKKTELIKKLITNSIKSIVLESNSNKLLIAKSVLDSGKLDKHIPVEDKQAFLSEINNKLGSVNYAMQIKFNDTVNNNVLNIAEKGVEITELTETDFINALGADKGKKQWINYTRDVSDAKKLYSDEYTLALGTPDEQLALINKRKKEAEGNFRNNKHYTQLLKVNEGLTKMLENSPVQFIERYRPDIFAKLDSEDNAVFQTALDDMVALQIDRGILKANVDVIGKAKAMTHAEQIISSAHDAEGVEALMITLKERYGEKYFNVLIKDIQEKGDLDERFVALLDYTQTPFFSTYLKQLRAATVKNGQIVDGTDIDATMRSKNSTLSRNSQWKNYVKTFGDDPAASEHLDGLEDLIVTISHYKGQRGESQSIKKVVDELITGHYIVTPEFAIPRKEVHGSDPDDFVDKAEFLIDALQSKKILGIKNDAPAFDDVIDPLGEALNPEGASALKFEMDLNDNTMWRQTAAGDGVELVWTIEGLGNAVVTVNDGTRYSFTWKELENTVIPDEY